MIEALRGLGTALITPFEENKKIDRNALKKLVCSQYEAGVDYLVVLGTTGENATLSDQEKREVEDIVYETLSACATSKIPLVLGMGGNNTQFIIDIIQANRDYLKNRYTALLSVCPYYNKPTQEGLFSHFAAIASVSPVPVLLYNVPSRTGVNLLPETAIRLHQTFPQQIIGIKEASGSIQAIKQLVSIREQSCLSSFLIICGDDGIAAQAMLEGADGLISVASNVWTKDFHTIVHQKDSTLQAKYQKAINLLFQEGNPVGVKAVMAKMGIIQNILRLPLVPCSDILSKEWDDFLSSHATT